jgi:hypothetical protein
MENEVVEDNFSLFHEYYRLHALAQKASTDLLVARNTLNIILPMMDEVVNKISKIKSTNP